MLFSRHSRLLFASSLSLLLLESLVGQVQKADAITIRFNYDYDTNGFFTGANSGRQALLNQAASYFEQNITDSLPALQPSGGENLTFTFFNPTTDVSTSLSSTSDPTIQLAQDELLIFVGSRNLGGSLGLGERGNSSLSGAGSTLSNAYTTRKEEASLWGGTISFDNTTDWYFGSDTSGLNSGKTDFLSVAVHEMAHAMGFGTSIDNWDPLVSGTVPNAFFTGTKSTEINSGNVPLYDGEGNPPLHWAEGTQSDGREAAMDPILDQGDRKLLTSLDYAGLDDIGWDVSSSAYATPVPFEVSPRLGIFLVGIFWGTRKIRTIWKNKNETKKLSQI